MMSRFALAAAGVVLAHAHTQDARKRQKDVRGWSVKRQIIGQVVFTRGGDRLGRIEDLILSDKMITHAVVGIGGFLGIGTYEVAIPIAKFERDKNEVVLPDMDTEALLKLPRLDWDCLTSTL